MNIHFALYSTVILLATGLSAMEEGQSNNVLINRRINNNNNISDVDNNNNIVESALQRLPKELVMHIVNNLDPRSLAAMGCVSRRYATIINSEPQFANTLHAHRATAIIVRAAREAERQRERDLEERNRDLRRSRIGCRSCY